MTFQMTTRPLASPETRRRRDATSGPRTSKTQRVMGAYDARDHNVCSTYAMACTNFYE